MEGFSSISEVKISVIRPFFEIVFSVNVLYFCIFDVHMFSVSFESVILTHKKYDRHSKSYILFSHRHTDGRFLFLMSILNGVFVNFCTFFVMRDARTKDLVTVLLCAARHITSSFFRSD